ncbi:MAG: hypothetical protein IT320_16290 [Anaerolineae bacterium]|nr:hypothetical protein [Anaerolineae bacterium]
MLWALAAVGILLIVLVILWTRTANLNNAVNDLGTQLDTVLERGALASPTDMALELRLLEGKAIYLQEQADQAFASLNTILTWTQALGIAVAVVAGIVTLVGFADNREEKQRLNADHERLATELKEARELYGKVSTLVTQLEPLPQRSAQAIQALSLAQVAQQQIQLKNLTEAVLRLEAAHRLDPENAVILYFLGDVCVRSGQKLKGLDYLKQVMSTEDPFPSAKASYAYALRLIGDDYYEQGDEEQGKKYYQEAEKLYRHLYIDNPELLDIFGESVYGALGGLYRRWGDVDNALLYYERALKTTPRSSYLLNNIAALEFCRNRPVGEERFKDALSYANEKLRIDNTDYWSIFDRTTAQIALGSAFDDIRKDLADAFKLTAADTSAVKKFQSGLNELLCANPLPPALLPAIEVVEAELKGRPDA